MLALERRPIGGRGKSGDVSEGGETEVGHEENKINLISDT